MPNFIKTGVLIFCSCFFITTIDRPIELHMRNTIFQEVKQSMQESNSKNRKGYKLIEVTENHFELCKILNEYDNKTDANNDLIELLTGGKAEKDILKEYSKKDIL